MPGPRSFTGEDMVEIYCHAGQIGLNAILDNILTFDCRPAEAGEFSLRRFLNHGVDLTRLEGAADIVKSKTDLAYRISREHLLGAYGDHVSGIRTKIVNLLAEIEADIDFPEEDDTGHIGARLLDKQLGGIIGDLEHLSDLYGTGRIIKDGYRVVIFGPVNAGKSSLFNRLVRQNRALVTPVPGTTRDYLSEWIDIDGLPVQLYDTAGLRPARGRVEKAGIDKTAKLLSRADLLLVIYDLSRTPKALPPIRLRKNQKVLVVFNKADLVKNSAEKIVSWRKKTTIEDDGFLVSAKPAGEFQS